MIAYSINNTVRSTFLNYMCKLLQIGTSLANLCGGYLLLSADVTTAHTKQNNLNINKK